MRLTAKRGFTILEMVVVMIIIGILATIAIGQYLSFIEKSRTSEAKSILMELRTAYNNYNLEHASPATSLTQLDLNEEVPSSCDRSHYYSYHIQAPDVVARRCTSGGKKPDFRGSAYEIRLNVTDGNWSGTDGYY